MIQKIYHPNTEDLGVQLYATHRLNWDLGENFVRRILKNINTRFFLFGWFGLFLFFFFSAEDIRPLLVSLVRGLAASATPEAGKRCRISGPMSEAMESESAFLTRSQGPETHMKVPEHCSRRRRID